MANKPEVAASVPAYRSGAVARLTCIPVETLRVWERRYKLVGPRQSASGHRLYSADDVSRLAVIKQLVDSGHAIGSIAALGLETLRGMLERAALIGAAPQDRTNSQRNAALRPVRIAIVGEALAMRVRHQAGAAFQIAGTGANAAQAPQALLGVTADALLIELPTLQAETPRSIRQLAQQLGALRIIVEYGLGPQRIEEELRAAGCLLLRAPMDVGALASLCGAPPADRSNTAPRIAAGIPSARRFDNKTLAEVSMASVTLNCECPHHIADLLMRLGNFEIYSEECENRSPADAELHQYLKQVAGSARAALEDALARVAQIEGIALPA